WKICTKRTPRSASRLAWRQLAANVPDLYTSGPYRSRTCFGSFERSISSGTDDCMRNAISYWAMRACVSGSATSSRRFCFSRPRDQFTGPHAGLAVAGELVLGRRDGEARLATGHGRQPLAVDDRRRQVLVEQVGELGLVVPHVHLGRPFVHEQVDGPLGLGREV